jgi:peroxiredoxin
MPYLHRAYEKYHAKGFEILSYSVDKNRDLVTSFRKRKGTPMPWLNAIDPQLREINGEVPKQFEITGLPAAFLIDANGKILATGSDIEGEDLEKMLAKIFNEPEAIKP